VLLGVAYASPSRVIAEGSESAVSLSPNLARDDTHLVARLADPLPFRDALLALHDVARSELYVANHEIERRQLDPVVTVAPGEVYFESFSLDESTYGRVSVREKALADVERSRFGTTNVEFSIELCRGLEEVRGRSTVKLRVAASGIELTADGEKVSEEKIELADSWVHGFLAVQASIREPNVALELHTGDLRNVITYLRGRKETVSPRSLRFRLKPKKAPSVLVEPWNETIELERSTHDATEDREVRVWGRRRLLLLQRALPGAKSARALLQGSGRPSFWTVDHGSVSVTLGLSPWTERDWAALDPMPLGAGDESPSAQVERVGLALEEKRRGSASVIAKAATLAEAEARVALDRLCRDGRALFDPESDAYLARRLFTGTPPPPPASAERERAALAIVKKGGVAVSESKRSAGERVVKARVKGNGTYDVTAVLGKKGLVRGICACPFFARHGLTQGACKHMLALARASED
jgi:hypothetical protein